MTVRGQFIAFEGGEGSGKSTQAARLAKRIDAVLTREPGGTEIGERIREIVLHAPVTPRTEALLMAAARAQHVAEVIEPNLAAGRHVVTDRFTGSSLAYQGGGRGLDLDELRALSAFATDGLAPDLVILLQVPLAVGRQRMGAPDDRLEGEADDFHARVAEGFGALAAADERWVIVDGTGSIDDVESRVHAAWTRFRG